MKKSFIVLLMLTAAFSSCKREKQYSRFNTNIIAPLAKASLDLNNLVGDSVLIPDANGALRLATSYTLYDGNLSDYFQVPDSARTNVLKLESLQLADQQIEQAVPLFLIFAQAVNFHGMTENIPALSGSGLPPIQLDGSDFFKEATMNSGTMEISIENGYPVEITELIFALRNEVDNSLITQDTFSNIAPGATQTKSVDLAGKTMYAAMLAEAISIQTAASNGKVLIDAYAETTVSIAVKNLKPQSAIARFPAQSVINEDALVVYNFGDAEVKTILIKSGRVSFNIASTIEEEMTAVYHIPNATKNGVPFERTFVVPAAPSGGQSTRMINYDLAGYTFDLRGKDPLVDDTVNTYYNYLNVTIDSTGIERNISLDDSIYVYVGLLDVLPEYAEGYFGSEKLSLGPETVDFEFLTNTQGSLSFEKIDVSLRMENGIGASAEAKINSITARNTGKGNALQLTGPGLAGPHLLPSATYPPLTRSNKVINLNSGNSNIQQFFELFPDKIDYHVEIQTNPGGNNGLYQDFVVAESDFRAILDVDIPMSVKANNLTLEDTIAFDFASFERSENIVEGALNLIADNGFPFEAKIQAYLMNENGDIIDSLVMSQNRIEPGNMDVNNIVVSPKRSVVVAETPLAKMPNLRATKKVLIKVVIDTPSSGSGYWKLYKNYTFDLSITGDFIYEQNN